MNVQIVKNLLNLNNMALKENVIYIAKIDSIVRSIERLKADTNHYNKYLEAFIEIQIRGFDKRVTNDVRVSVSDKAYLSQKLRDKINYLLTK